MKVGTTILLSLSLLFFHILSPWAQSLVPEHRVEEPPPYWLPEDLRLTERQMEQMQFIQRHYLEDMSVLRNELRNREFRLRRLLSDPSSQAAEIRSKQKELSALENRMQARTLDYQLEVREVLTPEQFRLWVSRQHMPFGRRGHHKHGRGRMHGHQP